jgi:hypothetical protein
MAAPNSAAISLNDALYFRIVLYVDRSVVDNYASITSLSECFLCCCAWSWTFNLAGKAHEGNAFASLLL